MRLTDWIEWGIIALFVFVCIGLLLGHCKWFIAGYNTAPEEEKEKYNSKKLCRTVGAGMSVIVILGIINILFDNVLPMEFHYIMGGIILADIVIMFILANTICRKK